MAMPPDLPYEQYPSEWFVATAATAADLADSALLDVLDAGHGSPVARVVARALIAQVWATIAGAVATRERTEVLQRTLTDISQSGNEPGKD
jgi:hypothetical protein